MRKTYEPHEQRPDPTPQEIAERTAEIRKGWSERRWRDAMGSYAPNSPEIPVLEDPNPPLRT